MKVSVRIEKAEINLPVCVALNRDGMGLLLTWKSNRKSGHCSWLGYFIVCAFAALFLPACLVGCGHEEQVLRAKASKELPTASTQEQNQPQGTLNDRKIVYTAQLQISVEKFDTIESEVAAAIESHQGYVAQANLSRMQGEHRSGEWDVRIPIVSYQSFMRTACTLGNVQSRKEQADDVTAQFYDYEARIKNKRRLEGRIAELLDRSVDDLKDIVSVENELARVREEIEKLEGRLRYFSDVSSMATIELTIQENQQVTSHESTAFSQRLASTWRTSCQNCLVSLQAVALFFVQNVFNLIFGLVGLFVVVSGFRQLGKPRQQSMP
ncbi:MAG: DUF4349 domain-containing protein [Planctomycetota bacterium]